MADEVEVRRPSPKVRIGGGNTLRQWGALGFGVLTCHVSPGDYTEETFAVVLPHWFLVLLTACLPTAWLAKFVRRARQRRRERWRGRCVQCGYDLRASRERCPECGTPIAM